MAALLIAFLCVS